MEPMQCRRVHRGPAAKLFFSTQVPVQELGSGFGLGFMLWFGFELWFGLGVRVEGLGLGLGTFWTGLV